MGEFIRMKRGIIQSRGLGDIVIALPIARHYHDQGDEIIWPVCEEFVASFATVAPWVTWVGVKTDPQGLFFLDTPLQVFDQMGVDRDAVLYLYQYLNSVPERTDPELFSILKFDQYKYQTAGVPFYKKWDLVDCIQRDPARERALLDSLAIEGPYVLTHLEGSSHRASVDLSWISEEYPAARVVEITALTDNIWDWLALIEGAAAVICVDSVYANMIDQLRVQGPDLYWIRRSGWDLTPVLMGDWTWVPCDLPVDEVKRVNPSAQTAAMRAAKNNTGLSSHVPFQTNPKGIPTNFMHALKPASGSTNIQAPNSAQRLLSGLGK